MANQAKIPNANKGDEMEKVLAFHFSQANKKLQYGDGRMMKTGRTHKVKCQPILCKQGLHASVRLIDALSYAPGPYLWLVELSGKVVRGDDKLVATERKYLGGFHADTLLREFARKQALINIEKIKPYCSDADYDLINRWLLTGDIKLRSAAESEADSAARSAAESAADSAAWSAAESEAESEARAASWAAARAASWAASNKMLTDMVRAKTGWNI